jgi:hypothetical protein
VLVDLLALAVFVDVDRTPVDVLPFRVGVDLESVADRVGVAREAPLGSVFDLTGAGRSLGGGGALRERAEG